MKTYKTIIGLLAAPCVLILSVTESQAAPQYHIKDLGTMGGAYSHAVGINENGQITGYSNKSANAPLHSFIWESLTGLTDLNTLGGTHALAAGINKDGFIVGNSQVTGDTATRGFVWKVGAMLELPSLAGANSRAIAINDNGVMVGAASLSGDSAQHAVLWQNSAVSAPIDLGTLGGLDSQGNDININGQVVGFAENANQAARAALWSLPYTGQPINLGTLGGTYSEALAINNSGQVTGIASNNGDTQFRGFIWQSGQSMVDIGALTATSTHTAGLDINNKSDIVGYSSTAGGVSKRAIVRKNGAALTDLNGLILPNTGWVLSEARSINDAGQIVGIGTLTKVDTVNNLNRVEHHAFLLTPDAVKPTITCPAAVVTTGNQPTGIGQAVATDDLDTAPTVTNNRPATFPNGDTTVIWTALDANGNAATCTQLVTIASDTTPPVVTFEVTPAAAASGWHLSTPSIKWSVTDAESAISNKTGCVDTPSVADTGPAGQSFSCAATSTGGTNTPPISTTLKVDTVKPVLADVPADFPQAATSTSGAVVNYGLPTATDASSGVAPTGVSCAPASGTAFAMGATTVTCAVTDNAGNSNSASFVVTVADQSPPVITSSLAGTAGLNGWYKSPVTVTWNVVDEQSAISSPACATETVSTDGAAQTKSCTATSSGGTASADTGAINIDTELPTLGEHADVIQTAAPSATSAVVTYVLPTATDAVSGVNAAGVSCLPASGASFAVGSTTVNCTVGDNAGNSSLSSFTVTVKDSVVEPPNGTDTTSPVIVPVLTGTVGANGWFVGPVTVSWNVTDVESAVTLGADCATATVTTNGANQIRTCTASSVGGSTTGTTPAFSIDTQAPVITAASCPATVSLTQGQALTRPTATDNLGTPSLTSNAPATLPLGTTPVTWTATDNAGLSATCTQQVSVTAPVTENITVTTATCRIRSTTTGEWVINGTSSITASNSIQLYATATVPANLTTSTIGTPRAVGNNGAWTYSARATPACSTRISLRSSRGTIRENITVNVRQ